MIDNLALILLGPVMLVQGKYVRWATSKLPEPPCERKGVVGAGDELGIFIVGDSAAAGVGVLTQADALSGQVTLNLQQKFRIRWRVLATSGDTSQHLIEKLRSQTAASYQTAIVSIGVNDVTAMVRPKQWEENLRSIVKLLVDKYSVQCVYFSSLPPMHRFPALPNPLRWWLGRRARRFDTLMANVAENEPGCVYVAVPYSQDSAEVAEDGFHPGPGSYAIWGQYIADLISNSVSSSRNER